MPTEVQRKVLERMARGDRIRATKGWDARASVGEAPNSETVRLPTVHILYRAGWIRAAQDDWRWSIYEITDAGRAALRATRPAGEERDDA